MFCFPLWVPTNFPPSSELRPLLLSSLFTTPQTLINCSPNPSRAPRIQPPFSIPLLAFNQNCPSRLSRLAFKTPRAHGARVELAAPVSSALCFLCSRASDCCLQRSRGDRNFLFVTFSYAVGEQLAECHETSSRMSLTGSRARFEAERTGVWFGI